MVQFLTDREIEYRALANRRALGFRDDQAIDVMTLINKLKHRYPNFGYERVPDDEWVGSDEARWNYTRKVIMFPESVFCSANRGEARARMTALHEVGHVLLQHGATLSRAPAGNSAEKYSKQVRRMEYQAKRYAAAFAVPDIIENYGLSAREIADKYQISMEAASIRVSDFADRRGRKR
jgi:hypothetical protein